MSQKHAPLQRQDASGSLTESQSYSPYETHGNIADEVPQTISGYPEPKGLKEVTGTGEKTSGLQVYQHPITKAHLCTVDQFHHSDPNERQKWRSIAAGNFRKAEKELQANQALVNQWS